MEKVTVSEKIAKGAEFKIQETKSNLNRKELHRILEKLAKIQCPHCGKDYGLINPNNNEEWKK